jgi:hypothetical protein
MGGVVPPEPAAKYVDAFQNIQWDEVNRRLESAQRRST